MSAADARGIAAARGSNSAARDGDGATGVVNTTADASTPITLGGDITTLDDDIAAVLLKTAADAGTAGIAVIRNERATTTDRKGIFGFIGSLRWINI